MKKFVAIVLLIVLTIPILTSCYASNKVKGDILPYPVSIQNVTIEKQPRAIASLSPSLTKILIELGYKDIIVGYSDDCEIPNDTPNKETMGTALKPNMEKIGELAPEIIFTTTPFTRAQMDKLDAVNIKVMVMPVVNSIENLIDRYLSIITVMSGQIEGATIGKALMDETSRQLDYIKSKVPSEKQSYLYVCSLNPLIATGDTYEADVISVVATNLAQDYTSYTVTAEQLKALDPDVIFFSSPLQKEHIEQNDMFKEKKAVKNGKLIELNQKELLNQTKDVAEIVRAIASKLYPDVDFNEPVPETPSSEEIKAKK